MPLAPATRLGAYEIIAPLGSGGMGEVYRARDTRLDRTVAVKVLPDMFSDDRERLARLEREAKTLASLNHPNIAQIYGFEQSGSTSAIVMEFIDGEDLARRIGRGPLPLDETVPIALQVADALAAAHEHGVIHRDLKPANIVMRRDGTVKVLDFGLARASAPQPTAVAVSNSPTMLASMPGVLLGTAAYMSPEQARGKAVDCRT